MGYIHLIRKHFPPYNNQGVYWNGAIHWAPTYDDHIMCFDIEVERLQTLPFPMSSEVTDLGESRGHLHLIVTEDYGESMSYPLDVYEMLGDRSGWFLRYHVEFGPEMINYGEPGRYIFVMDVVRGEKEEDTFMVVKVDMKLIAYNVHYKSFKHIFNLDNYLDGSGYHRYTETLASI